MKPVKYFQMGQWPCFVGFTSSNKAFDKEMKRMKCDGNSFLSRETADATCHWLEREGHGDTFIIALKRDKTKSVAQVAALIAHECTHVKQFIFQSLGEKSPGKECEAYLVQHLVQQCLLALKAGH